MKQSSIVTMNDMASELSHLHNISKDIVIPSQQMKIESGPEGSLLGLSDGLMPYHTNSYAIQQLATKTGIPVSYYKTMREKCPQLLDVNMNYWLQTQNKPTMVRTHGSVARAFLSDRFKRVDNSPIFDMVSQAIHGKGVNLVSSAVTDRRMYLKFTSPRLEGEVATGDPIQMGITISNSEVGNGALEVRALIYRLVCQNGMVSPQDYGESIRRTHLGAKQPLGVLYEQDTVAIEGQAMGMKIRDTINQLLLPETFEKHLNAFREAKEKKIEGTVPEVIRATGKALGFAKEHDDAILRNLIDEGGLNQYSLLNSLTAYAQDDGLSYDQASQFEVMGGKLLNMAPRQWKTISQAAA